MISLCHIPSGQYTIGSAHHPNASPPHIISLAAFGISRTTITNAQYALFMDDGGYEEPFYWTEMGWRWKQSKKTQSPYYWNDPAFNTPEQPIVGVTWYEAVAYARWLAQHSGLAWRLPTEAEWEAAARPPEGGEPIIGNVASAGPQPADSGPETWCGARHMLGNVWEWCSSRWGRNWQTLAYPYPYQPNDGRENLEGSYARIIRGGSYYDPPQEAHPAVRGRYLPGSRASNIGFRLALSL